MIAPVQRSQADSSFPLHLRTELSFGCKHRGSCCFRCWKAAV